MLEKLQFNKPENGKELSYLAGANTPSDILNASLEIMQESACPVLLIWGAESLCFYNKAFAAYFRGLGLTIFDAGTKAQDALGNDWQELAPFITRSVNEKKSEIVIFDHIATSCSKLFMNAKLRPVFDETGSVAGIYISCVQPAQGSPLLNELTFNHGMYDAITGSTPDLMYIFDLNYKFLYANRALLEMWGRTWDESIGQGLLALGYEPWHAEMHEREIDEVVRTKKLIRGSVSFPHATLGSRIYDYIFAPVFNDSGEVTAVAGTTRDISELKQAALALQQSENQFRTLTESLPQLIWTSRADGFCDFFNDKWYEYTGGTMDALQDKGWTTFIHPLQQRDVLLQWEKSLYSRKQFTAEFQLLGLDGQYHWFYLLCNPIIDEHNTVHTWVGTLTDIAPQKAVESELERIIEERTRELYRSNSDLQQFAHVASHDLSEPVRKIMTFTNLLQTDLSNTFSARSSLYLEKIKNALNRMDSMIKGVLNYSTLTNIEELFATVDLNEVIHNVQTDLELKIEEKKVRIVCGHLPKLSAAPVLIHQLFYNLINNSLKFTREDNMPVICIESSTFEQGGRWYVRVDIKDNGIGFKQDDAEKIFKTFTRLNAKDRYDGTGLGLALCKKIAERHGGTISATGQENQGAVFSVFLPVVQQA